MRRHPISFANAGLSLMIAAAAFLAAFVGPDGRAGALPRQTTSTTNCVPAFSCQTTTVPTTVPVTEPPTTAPPTTTAPTTTPPATVPTTRVTTPRTTIPAPTTTATTLPSIGANLPVTPSTVPFTTKTQSSHVSPMFAELSGAGFFLALVIVGLRLFMTRRGRP